MDKHLFLFGGGPPFTKRMARKFVQETTKKDAPISLLVVEREGWEQYITNYTDSLFQLGVKDIQIAPLPSTPINKVLKCIENSSGIVIGGGDTNLYADYIVDTPIADVIKQKYEDSIPVAGFSAGALISPEECILSAKDNVLKEFQHRKGLGLVSDILLAVHFTQWKDQNHLREAVKKFNTHVNYGIDEKTCVYLLNGSLADTEGYGVYSIINDRVVKVHANSSFN
ncbi:Type 1 glutamine amidotransferase-like domain-containing protein [Chengkuizengella axinellae]|uniref:Type 1 glutamine amidotransferase-like domain-containing protein n=1 Tax=Chengkuizengella axinellae TaxID=3064388 RepID=A0ABT9IZA0_9BACL|nr:Type 1 glutamine amidotransferase-like domain-containing protein [Chengkuizengella sp. 2205SS18-9]MDP5274110.1 Type 1 glutamine amidotransferase-like domain-containing protein [Chengkuizengella sp. 2205SS18-9]